MMKMYNLNIFVQICDVSILTNMHGVCGNIEK